MQRISSRDNEQVRYACRLASTGSFRLEENVLFAEGIRLCLDLAATLTVCAAFYTQRVLKEYPQVEYLCENSYLINDPVDDKLAQTKTPQGLYCLFGMPSTHAEQLDYQKGVIVCEAVQDPTNIGAMLRSVAAFGLGGAVLLPGCADPFAPRALRASMGAAGRLPVAVNAELQEVLLSLQQCGGTLFAAALQGAQPLSAVKAGGPYALLIGNEGAGLSNAALHAAHQRVFIPMHSGMDSLNAAAAAAVMMYHFSAGGQ